MRARPCPSDHRILSPPSSRIRSPSSFPLSLPHPQVQPRRRRSPPGAEPPSPSSRSKEPAGRPLRVPARPGARGRRIRGPCPQICRHKGSSRPSCRIPATVGLRSSAPAVRSARRHPTRAWQPAGQSRALGPRRRPAGAWIAPARSPAARARRQRRRAPIRRARAPSPIGDRRSTGP